MRDNKSEKNGTASPMMNEMTHPPKTMAIQDNQPMTVCELR